MNLWIVTGARGSGKTTFCKEMVVSARQLGWNTAGILSPAIFCEGIKEGITAESIRDGERRILAHIHQQNLSDLHFGDWYFNQETLGWGNRVIRSSTPCDLLMIDELGPLEFNLQTGWVDALEVLKEGGYQQAVVVIRPELLEVARVILPPSETMRVKELASVRDLIARFMGRIKSRRGLR